jgi:hypothetical protein
MMQRLKFMALVVLAAAGACGDDGEGFDPTDEVQIRAVNAAPGAPALEVRITDTQIADNLAYGQSTNYETVSGGNQILRVNSDFGDQNEELFAVEAPLTAGAAYTAVVTGGDGGIIPILITDDNSPPPTGQAKFRAMHAAPTAEQVDVYVTAPGADLAATTPTFTAITFGTASSYATLPAGAYQVRVTPTGLPEVLIDSGALQLNEGDIRTAVAIESPAGGAPYSAVVLDDRAE